MDSSLPGRSGLAAGGLVLAALLTACSGGAASSTSPSATSSSPGSPSSLSPPTPDTALPPAVQGMVECPDGRDRPFVLRARGERITGFRRGSGHRVAILTHQSRGTPCDLAALGHRLAAAGFRVVAWTSDGGASERAMTLLVAEERRRGARYVALVGASLGAATSITSAARISPPVDAVVALSAASQSERSGDVVRAAARYRGPLMAVAGEFDPSFAKLLPELAQAHPGPEQIDLVEKSSDHGKDFVRRESDPMAGRVLAFLGS